MATTQYCLRCGIELRDTDDIVVKRVPYQSAETGIVRRLKRYFHADCANEFFRELENNGGVYQSNNPVKKHRIASQCYRCHKPFEDDETVKTVEVVVGNKAVLKDFHPGCDLEFFADRGEERTYHFEQKEWDKVYNYFKTEILLQDVNSKLSQYATKRLLGLATGDYMPSNANIYGRQTYSFEVILNTLKLCKPIILQAFKGNKFKDDKHMVNYAMKIIQGKIDWMKTKTEQAEKRKEVAQKAAVVDTVAEDKRAKEYKPQGTGQKKYEDIVDFDIDLDALADEVFGIKE